MVFSVPVVAAVALLPDRLPVTGVVAAAVLVLVALTFDVLFVLLTTGAGGDFGPRIAAGAVLGHLGVTWGAAAPSRLRSNVRMRAGSGNSTPAPKRAGHR